MSLARLSNNVVALRISGGSGFCEALLTSYCNRVLSAVSAFLGISGVRSLHGSFGQMSHVET